MVEESSITSVQAKLLICITEAGHGKQLLQTSKAASDRRGRFASWMTSAYGVSLDNMGSATHEQEVMFMVQRNKVAGVVAASFDYFQLGDTVQRNRVSSVISAIKAQSEESTPPFCTTVLVLNVPDYYVHKRKDAADNANAERSLNMKNQNKLIIVIVNRGMGEEVMATARSAGAKSGTLLKAFGNELKEDTTFFGVPLAPEKELLMIIAEAENAEHIALVVRGMPNFSGGGIIFSLDIDETHNFGVPAKIDATESTA